MLILHNEFKPDIRPGEPIGYPPEKAPADNPSLTEEEKKKELYEKRLSEPEATTPFHQRLYVRILLGALLLMGLIFFYVRHISSYGPLGFYDQNPKPAGITPQVER